METKRNKAIDKAQIRQLIDGWVKAVRAKNMKGLIFHYTPATFTILNFP